MQTQIEIRQQITNDIIAALSSNCLPPWRKPWANDPNAPGLHTSLSTGNSYRGINQLILQLSAMKQSFTSKWWGTFSQIKGNGGSVCKGQRATKIILWKPIDRKRKDGDGESVKDKFFLIQQFAVFNADQTSGLDQFKVGFDQPEVNQSLNYENADRVIAATEADIHFGGNLAFYSPGGDFIQMPFRHQFVCPQAFYETAFHELCHWTEDRCGFDRKQAENSYALGELVAEMGACFLMGELQMPTTENLENHAAYINNWVQGMKGDPKFIFRSAALASKATDYILSFSATPDPVSETAEEPALA